MKITHDDDGSGKLLLVRLGRTIDVLQPGQSMTIAPKTDGETAITVQHGIPGQDR